MCIYRFRSHKSTLVCQDKMGCGASMCSGGALEAVPRGPFDVAISATSEDSALADFIKGEDN